MPTPTTQTARTRARGRGRARQRASRKPLGRSTPKKKTRKVARLEARIHPELRALIRRAADLEGRKVTEFVTTALQRAAQRAIAESQVLRLAAVDQARFAQALIVPPAPTPALKRAFTRRGALSADT